MYKLLLVFMLSTGMLLAYTVGDTVDKSVVQKLNLKKDRLYVIDFFASWCHSCKKEMPLISKVYRDKVVSVIGINVDKDIALGKAFVSKHKVPFPVVYDKGQKLIALFNPAGVPALYYIKNGKVLAMHIGAMKNIDMKIKEEVKGLK
ncbi:Thioredoxin family protein [hydrothermal vent metagenome]|uniref:Thioredoxin family protein n=1 Tax=hydrothermal vent metagenome TaxID=652676 RepID=A0A1W1C7Q4_9ZZZZ